MWPSKSGLILLYHRIAELRSDPQLLAVTPLHFAAHLEVLRDQAFPVSLAQLKPALRDRRAPLHPIAVTLDDGYADNLECGRPLLERYEIPATVFVATHLGGDREFWWDDLERLLLLPGQLPKTLCLRIGSTIHEWHLGGARVYSEHDYQRHRDWNVELEHDPSPRHTAYRMLCRLLRRVSGAERAAAIDDLSGLAGATSVGRPTHRALRPEELVQLIGGGVVDAGAHGSSHSVLSVLTVAAQRSEIAGAKARLEEVAGRGVTSFAYPFGGRGDYTRATVALVREAGFTMSCANIGGRVRPRSDPFQLPRVLVRNWDAETFAGRLREWLG